MKIRYGTERWEKDRRMVVWRILEEREINPETVIVAINGEVVTEDDFAQPGDDVEIVRAISGG